MADEPLTTRDLADPEASRAPADDEDDRDDRARSEDAAEAEPAVSADDGRQPASGSGREPLLPDDQSERLTARWQEIQGSFVDQPRRSVEEADALVADLMQRLAAGFSDERQCLETQWDRGDDVSTEDLRVALTRYRSFFDRLLSA